MLLNQNFERTFNIKYVIDTKLYTPILGNTDQKFELHISNAKI